MKTNPRSATLCSRNFSGVPNVLAQRHRRQGSAGWRIAGALALGVALSLGPSAANAAILVLSNPVQLGNNIDIEATATNNDFGAIYNSGTHFAFQLLFSQLYDLPVNSDSNHPAWTGFNSLEDFIAGANMGISPSAPSNVSNGWNVTKNNDGSVEVNNIGGRPTDYHQWFDNVTQPFQSTQSLVYTVPRAHLAIGFDENDQAIEWASIVLSSETQAGMFVGTTTGGFSIPAEGQFYQVQIPEPSTYAALFGCLVALVVGCRRGPVGQKLWMMISMRR